MGFKRVLKSVAAACVLGSVLGGCVVHPLYWGEPHYEREHYGYYGYGPGYGPGPGYRR